MRKVSKTRLLSLFDVDLKKGTLRWRVSRTWRTSHGRWPKEIDHKNMVRDDNGIANLRKATRPQNCANSGARRTSKSGIRGVWWSKEKKKWTSQIERAGAVKSLGYFDDKGLAALAYQTEARKIYGEFARQ